MAQFSYKARRKSGEVVQGVLDVADRGAALTQIERLGLFPVMVEAAKGAAVAKAERAERRSPATPAGVLPPALRALLNRQRRPKLQELATFTQQLANLLQSGMPLTVALNSMSHLESKGISSEVSKQLKQDVMEWLERLAPVGDYRHHQTGEDNADAHLKRTLMHHQVTLPVTGGKLDLGPWEQVFLRGVRRPAEEAGGGEGHRGVILAAVEGP